VNRGARVALALLAAVACSNANDLGNGVIAIQVTPPNPTTIALGDTVQFQATALDENGDSVAAAIYWVTPDTTLTIVDSVLGLVTGRYPNVTGRVGAYYQQLNTSFTTLTIQAQSDTIIMPTVVTDTVAETETQSAPLVATLASFNPAGPLSGRALIYEIVQPVFADTAARTVEFGNLALADTVLTGSDGTPVEPIVVQRTGATVPPTVVVQVRSAQVGGGAVPGSGQAFTIVFF
jgi:hypothetical protein